MILPIVLTCIGIIVFVVWLVFELTTAPCVDDVTGKIINENEDTEK